MSKHALASDNITESKKGPISEISQEKDLLDYLVILVEVVGFIILYSISQSDLGIGRAALIAIVFSMVAILLSILSLGIIGIGLFLYLAYAERIITFVVGLFENYLPSLAGPSGFSNPSLISFVWQVGLALCVIRLIVIIRIIISAIRSEKPLPQPITKKQLEEPMIEKRITKCAGCGKELVAISGSMKVTSMSRGFESGKLQEGIRCFFCGRQYCYECSDLTEPCECGMHSWIGFIYTQ